MSQLVLASWTGLVTGAIAGATAAYYILHKHKLKPTKTELNENSNPQPAINPQETLLTVLQANYQTNLINATTVSIPLPNDDLKGKLIGREGRNIRIFEEVTGVNLIIDETPERVTLSSFDPRRRMIAQITLLNLILDDRIHPAQIKEICIEATNNLDRYLTDLAKATAESLGLCDIPTPVLEALGQLTVQHHISQNLFEHSVEVAKLAGKISAEIQADPRIAARAGLLHDIGKALPSSDDHAQTGADFLHQHGESPEIVKAVRDHHTSADNQSPLTAILQLANNLSSQRPGARRPAFNEFIQRIQSLENQLRQETAIQDAYAIKAGSEIRILLTPNHQTSDLNQIQTRVKQITAPHGPVKISFIQSADNHPTNL